MKSSVKVLPTAIALASFMTREADAIYLPGIVRLFRGDGGLTDAVTSDDDTDLYPTGATPTFPDETPYHGVPRKVFYFDGTGQALGSPKGLPSGSESRTIVGWIKKEKETNVQSSHIFGYGGKPGNPPDKCNSAYSAAYFETDFMLDQWCTEENVGRFTTTFDEWFHFAATWDGTENRVYIDSEKKGEAAPNRVPATNTAAELGGYVYLGGHPSLIHPLATGFIADYAIFDRALSDEEVKSIYRSKLGLVAEAPPALTKKEKYSMSLVQNSTVVAFDTSSKKNEIVFDLKVSNEIDLTELRDKSTVFDHANCAEAIAEKFISAKTDKINTFLNDINSNFVNVPVLVDVETDMFGESDIPSGYYSISAESNEVQLKFCVKSELGQSDIINLDANSNALPGVDKSSISYTKVKFEIIIDMETGFTTDLKVKEDSASTASKDVDIAYTLNAYECDDDDTKITEPPTKTQNSMIRICIQTPENNDVVIASIKDFKLKSDSIASNAISESDPNALTEVKGENTKTVAVTTQMVSAFFSDLDPAINSTIDVEGTAIMEFKATGERKLVRISSNNQKNGNVSDMDRKLDGDAGLGEFEMKVGISKSSSEANGAATSGASNALSATPLVTVTSLALGGVLMGTMF